MTHIGVLTNELLLLLADLLSVICVAATADVYFMVGRQLGQGRVISLVQAHDRGRHLFERLMLLVGIDLVRIRLRRYERALERVTLNVE